MLNLVVLLVYLEGFCGSGQLDFLVRSRRLDLNLDPVVSNCVVLVLAN